MKKLLVFTLALGLLFSLTAVAYADTAWTERLAGADRIETAIEISQDRWADSALDNMDIIICRSDNFPDALSAAALAGWFECPILLNPSNALDERVEDEIDRLFNDADASDTVWIIGGTGAISSGVEDDLEDLGCEVERIGGTDRYDTARNVAEELDDQGATIDHIFVATGENFPDALAASAYSYYDEQFPILLTRKDELPSSTLDWLLSNKDVDAYVIGGEGVVSSDVMQDLGYYLNGSTERIYGSNRYETAVAVAEDSDLWDYDRDTVAGGTNFVFATGLNFPDALSGSSACDFHNAPLILTSSLDPEVEDYFTDAFDGDEGWGIILGGTGAVSKSTEDDIADLLSDGDFEATTDEPTINSFDVTINPDNDLPDVAQYDEGDSVQFDVETDERIYNEDGTLGKVVIEDISELGGNTDPYDEDDFELLHTGGDASSDNTFSDSVAVAKKSTSPDETDVTFVARATNQAGSDTMESDEVTIYN